MKITDEMIAVARDASIALNGRCSTYLETKASLETALALVPDVEPFTFAGYPDNPVYLHVTCGTVVDVSPVKPNDTLAQIDAGECDCENTSPWKRIYVERETGE